MESLGPGDIPFFKELKCYEFSFSAPIGGNLRPDKNNIHFPFDKIPAGRYNGTKIGMGK
jgi:hypothetical protein